MQKIYEIGFRHFNKYLFKADGKYQDWTLATENNDIDLAFKTFLLLFNITLYKHDQLKQVIWKNKRRL